MKNSLRKKIFWHATGLVVGVLLVQLILFAVYEVWEFYEHQQMASEFTATSYAEVELQELFVLMIIGLITLPGIIVFTWYFVRRTLSPLETMVQEIAPVGEGQLERRLSEYTHQDEIGVLVNTVNAALDRYHVALDAQERFASNASHELRTPLTVMRTQAEVTLSQERSVEVYKGCIHSICEESKLLLKIVEQLLVLARMDSDTLKGSSESVTLASFFSDLLANQHKLVSEKGVRVEFLFNQAEVLTYPVFLRLIFTNLLSNALHVVPDQGLIQIASERLNDGRLRISVLDSGPGLPAQMKEAVFERFQRLGETHYEGSGLGLSIVSDAAKCLGAEVEISRTPEAMTQFSILLSEAKKAI